MVYNLDKYIEAFPKKNVATLKKFVGYAKNLHEMSTEEINAIISNWEAVIPATSRNQKSAISLYFDWLAENGIVAMADVDGITFPVKTPEFLIYSSKTLHEYWKKFFTVCEQHAAESGVFYSRTKYLIGYVAGILSFYGLTEEQILDIDLSDVQKDGIIGYDLPLTQKDIDVLLEYKSLNVLANNKKVSGYKYIRVAGVVNAEAIDRGVNSSPCKDENKYLKRLLTFKNAYKLGRYAEIYAEEKRTGKLVDLSNRVIPADWFLKQIELIVGRELKEGRITAYKKDYDAYRSERMAYEVKHPEVSEKKPVAVKSEVVTTQASVPTENKAELINALKYVDVALDELDKMRVQLLGVKMQIEKIVKK